MWIHVLIPVHVICKMNFLKIFFPRIWKTKEPLWFFHNVYSCHNFLPLLLPSTVLSSVVCQYSFSSNYLFNPVNLLSFVVSVKLFFPPLHFSMPQSSHSIYPLNCLHSSTHPYFRSFDRPRFAAVQQHLISLFLKTSLCPYWCIANASSC